MYNLLSSVTFREDDVEGDTLDPEQYVNYPHSQEYIPNDLRPELQIPTEAYRLRDFIENGIGISVDDFMLFPFSYYMENFDLISSKEYTLSNGESMSIPNIVEIVELDKRSTEKQPYSLNIDLIVNSLRFIGPTHNKQKFASAVFKFVPPLSAALLIFNSGTIICTGSNKLLVSLLVLESTLHFLRQIPQYSDIDVGFHTIRNIVGHGKLPFPIDMTKFIRLTDAKYEPGEFAGAVHKDQCSSDVEILDYEIVYEDDEDEADLDGEFGMEKYFSLMLHKKKVVPKKKVKKRIVRKSKIKCTVTCLVFANGQFIIVGARSYDMLRQQSEKIYKFLEASRRDPSERPRTKPTQRRRARKSAPKQARRKSQQAERKPVVDLQDQHDQVTLYDDIRVTPNYNDHGIRPL